MEYVDKLTVSPEKRQVLHRLLDRMCDNGEPSLMWEAYFRGDEPFTMKKKRMWLSLRISDEIERR